MSLRIRGVSKGDIVFTVTNYLIRERKQKRSFVSTQGSLHVNEQVPMGDCNCNSLARQSNRVPTVWRILGQLLNTAARRTNKGDAHLDLILANKEKLVRM